MGFTKLGTLKGFGRIWASLDRADGGNSQSRVRNALQTVTLTREVSIEL
jgi:hypothetical protein